MNTRTEEQPGLTGKVAPRRATAEASHGARASVLRERCATADLYSVRHARSPARLTRLDVAWTHHARQQAQRRSISISHVEWVLEVGTLYFAGSGAIGHFCGRRATRERCCPDNVRGVAVIVADDRSIITVMHAPRPPQHWRRAR
jgi:hypothetical protein